MLCTFEYLKHPQTMPVPEGSYMVAIFKPEKKVPDQDGNLQKWITVVGMNLPTAKKVKFDIQGRWECSGYGLQYKMESYREVVEPTEEAIVSYLSSGILKGIGLRLAKRIYDLFGNTTMEVLEKTPHKLLRVPGISPEKLQRIKDSMIVSRGLQELLALGKPFMTAQKAGKILAQYKSEAMQQLKQNPYRFYEDGFLSFAAADSIAVRNGILAAHPLRLKAGLLYCLKRQEQHGHACPENPSSPVRWTR